MTIDELRDKAMSKDGVWVYALEEVYDALFPDAPEDEKYVPLKIYKTPDSVRVYSIWTDGLPCLRWYDADDAFFEPTKYGVRFVTIGRQLVEVARQEDVIDREVFIDWFLDHLEISREEYKWIVMDGGKNKLPRISTIGGVEEEEDDDFEY